MKWIPEPMLVRMRSCGLSPDDLVLRVARSSGPGGQRANKVSTAVEISHGPSGITAVAEDSRSQFANRELALARLCEKFETASRKEALAKRSAAYVKRKKAAGLSAGERRRRVEAKRRRSVVKEARKKIAI